MPGRAAGFLVIALLAGLFGFTSLAGAAADVARIIFWVFLTLFATALVARALRKGERPWRDADQR